MKLCAFSIILLFISLSAFSQTCIIILNRNDSIFVAADSKSDLGNHKYHLIRKVRVVKNYNYAVSGYPDSEINKIASRCCEEGKDINEVISLFRNKMLSMLSQQLEGIRVTDSHHYIERFTTSSICAVSFFGFENYKSYVKTLAFDAINKPTEQVKIKDTLLLRNYEILGYREKISHLPISPYENGVFNGMEKLIKIEMNEHPDNIGFPIDLLLVTKSGSRWVRKQKDISSKILTVPDKSE